MASKQAETLLATRRGSDATWHGTAFVVEALVLLAFLAFALAVFMQLFGTAHARGIEERTLTQAVVLASNSAEEFAAAPSADSSVAVFDEDGNPLDDSGEDGGSALVVTREATSEKTGGGTLYRASIAVERAGETVYELETARYASDGAKGGDAA